MINNKTILLSTVFIVFVSISLPTEATDNPFRKASAITKKYLPQAFKAMWQSEYLVWRAQLFNSACSQKQLGVSNAINSSFPLFNQYIIDQAIMNESFQTTMTSYYYKTLISCIISLLVKFMPLHTKDV